LLIYNTIIVTIFTVLGLNKECLNNTLLYKVLQQSSTTVLTNDSMFWT